MGREIPPSSISMLRLAERAQVDVRILSECNTVFINSMLVGEACDALDILIECNAE